MFEHNPVLRERMLGFGAFAGIGLFAFAAVDVMVTGGFDFAPGRGAPAPASAFARAADVTQPVSDRVHPLSWTEPLPLDEASAATAEELAGANDGTPPPDATPTGDDLYREIAALYERSEPEENHAEELAYEDAPASDEGAETIYEDEFSPEEAEKLASASASASPW